MTANMGTTDRIVRAVAGVALVVAAFVAGIGSVLGIVLAVLAVVMLATSAVSFCPLYKVFGLSTRPAASKQA
ncbi:DUF2892 domain-containing protein [Actinotalea sp. M2MS4P-6]|uniref:YgaP family membrane protein n=1 Tax=Actinotalea sp. M2MS4P-6 TaxID=2983762 RepID=UPI0021E35D19|nr:DUF2892 domain-containing protein [Actinotalea sp. M2MS4P-6]MCV2393542.1 DUF2892 domain-containing protein [Actinotalea sp. M2MS4P-6]